MLAERRIGTILLILSSVAWSLSGIFSKAVAVDAWTIIFWRAFFSVFFIAAYVAIRDGRRCLGVPSRATLAVATVSAIGTAFFIPAFKHTSIANVTLIYATVPLMTAPVAWMWLGERATRGTILAALACLAGMAIIVAGSVGTPHLLGDGLALGMTAAMAVMLTLFRRFPQVRGTSVNLVSSVFLMAAALLATRVWPLPSGQILVLAVFGGVFAFAYVTLAEGAKRVPAAETALLGLLETPLAPIWAWLAFGELPSAAALAGGAIILASILIHIAWSARKRAIRAPDGERPPRPAHRRCA